MKHPKSNNPQKTWPGVVPAGKSYSSMDPCPDGALCVFEDGKCMNCGVPQSAYEKEDEE